MLKTDLEEHIKENGPYNLTTARAYNKIAKLHFYQKSYTSALENFEAELSTHLGLQSRELQLEEKIKAYYNCASLHRLLGNYPKAFQLAEKALFWSIQHYGESDSETIDIFKLLANISMFWKRPDLQLKYSNKALHALEQLAVPDSSEWVDLSLLKAVYFLKTGNYTEGEELLKQVKEVAENIELTSNTEAKLYTDLGVFYEYQDQNAEALHHYKKALAIRLEAGGEKQISVAWLWDNMGIVFNKLEQFEQALDYFKKSYKLTVDLLGRDHPRSLELMMHKATALTHIDQPKAILLFEEQIRQLQKSFGIYCLEQTLAIQKLGSIAYELENYKEAILKAEKADLIFQKNKHYSHIDASKHYFNQAHYYEQNEQYQKAARYYQKSIKLNKYGEDYLSPVLCLKTASALLRIPDLRLVETSLIEEMMNLINREYVQQQFRADQKDFLAEAKDFYEAALGYLYQQSATKKRNILSWNCINSSKAVILAEAINFQDLCKQVGLPDSLQKQIQKTLAEERLYQNQWLAAEASMSKAQINEQYRWLQAASKKRKILEDELYQNYPQLSKSLNRFHKEQSLDQLQQDLSIKDAILNYFEGEDHYYRMILRQNRLDLDRIPRPSLNKLSSLLESLRGKAHAFPEVEDFTNLIWPISQVLLPSDSLLVGVERLIISADGALNYLPFELLLTKITNQLDYKNLDYCIKKYAISYQFQLNDLINYKKTIPKTSFLGISPLYPKKIEIGGAKEELKVLEALLSGDFYYNELFSKAEFLQQAEEYGFIHLAMHAKAADIGQAFLLFSEESQEVQNQLQMQELAGLDLSDCQMLVLSACETGLGHYEKGEGVMSLGRAFAENGVHAQIISLWALPDQLTQELILAFYQNLKKGWTKDRALQVAKLDYLKTAGRLKAQPVCWSALVLWGDREAIELPKASFSQKCYYLWAILITFSIAFVWLLGYYFPSRKR